MEGLRDIKGLLDIQEYSLYFLIAIIFACILVLFFILRKLFSKKRQNKKERNYKKEFKELEIDDAKECAYQLSLLLPYIIKEKEVYEEFLSSLQKYKYKKEVGELSSKEKATIESLKDKYC